MPRPSVVLDTNVVVSAHLCPRGLERFVYDLGLNGTLELFCTTMIFEEYEGVLSRAKFRISPAKLAESLALIRQTARFVVPKRRLQVAIDPGDNIFLECAEEARTQYLVTGNKKHFPTVWKTTQIVNSRELIDEIIADLKR